MRTVGQYGGELCDVGINDIIGYRDWTAKVYWIQDISKVHKLFNNGK